VETKSIGNKHATAEKKTVTEKVKSTDAKDQSFWVLLEGVLNDVLTPAESTAVLAKLKKVCCASMLVVQYLIHD
jgi:hypothetical protein